jgi:hypothetical protein
MFTYSFFETTKQKGCCNHKLLILFLFITIIGIGCKRQNEIRGTFINKSSEEIVIDCNHQITISHLIGQPFIPNKGSKIKLSSNSIKADCLTIVYTRTQDYLLCPFAEWDRKRDEIVIGQEIYKRKGFAKCK